MALELECFNVGPDVKEELLNDGQKLYAAFKKHNGITIKDEPARYDCVEAAAANLNQDSSYSELVKSEITISLDPRMKTDLEDGFNKSNATEFAGIPVDSGSVSTSYNGFENTINDTGNEQGVITSEFHQFSMLPSQESIDISITTLCKPGLEEQNTKQEALRHSTSCAHEQSNLTQQLSLDTTCTIDNNSSRAEMYQQSTHSTIDVDESSITSDDQGKIVSTAQQLNHKQKLPIVTSTESSSDLYLPEIDDAGKKWYTCSKCGKTFSNLGNLKMHMRGHRGERPFKCSLCDKAFTRSSDLKRHGRIHTGEKPYTCNQCSRSFSTHGSLASHVKTHTKPFDCDEYGNVERGNLNDHIRTHTRDKPFSCCVCGKSFAISANRNRHLKTHLDDDQFSENISQRDDMANEKGINTAENPLSSESQNDELPMATKDISPVKECERRVLYVCKKCGKKFKDIENLKIHMQIHSKQKRHQCNKCGKDFALEADLERHSEIHSIEKPFTCSECGKTFSQQRYLLRHARIHSDERPFSCEECGKAFTCNAILRNHRKTHFGEKKFICSECGKAFLHSFDLKRHVRIHTGEKPFKCKECGRKFTNSGQYNDHLRIHTGESPYRCLECGKSYLLRHHLKEHMHTHSGVRPYNCDECGKTFSSYRNLKYHTRTHTGEKPYGCKECDRAFNRSSDLRKHVRIHTGEKPYRCSVCTGTFTTLDILKRHIRTTHTNKAHKISSSIARAPSQTENDVSDKRIHEDSIKTGEVISGFHLDSWCNEKPYNITQESPVKASIEIISNISNISDINLENVDVKSEPEQGHDVSKIHVNSRRLTSGTQALSLDFSKENSSGLSSIDNEHSHLACDTRHVVPNHTQELPVVAFKEDGYNIGQYGHRNNEKNIISDDYHGVLCPPVQANLTYEFPLDSGQENSSTIFDVGINLQVKSEIGSDVDDDVEDEIADFHPVSWSTTEQSSHSQDQLENISLESCSYIYTDKPEIDELTNEIDSGLGRLTSYVDGACNPLQSNPTRLLPITNIVENRCESVIDDSGQRKSHIDIGQEVLNVVSDQPLRTNKQSKRKIPKVSRPEKYVPEIDDDGNRWYTCPKCGKIFNRLGNLKAHMRGHSGLRPFKCNLCDKAFVRPSDLTRHKRIHTGEKPYTCNQCSKRFSTPGSLASHIKSHTGVKSFVCDQCGKPFAQRGSLNDHIRTHTGEKPFICGVCDKRFAKSANRNRHLRTHLFDPPFNEQSSVNTTQSDETANKNGTSTIQDSLSPETQTSMFPTAAEAVSYLHGSEGKKLNACKECGKKFKDVENLNCHMRIHAVSKPHKCNECGKRFGLEIDLDRHIQMHSIEKPYKCSICSRTFSQHRYLSRHTRIHTGERPFSCKECGKAFTRAGILKKHMKIHFSEKQFVCLECGKAFLQSFDLKRHIRVHTGEKPFKCDECGRTFINSGHYNDHLRIHTGEVPYKCDDCGKTFTLRHHLKTHRRIHTGERPHSCCDCGMTFSTSGALNYHKRTNTREKPFCCTDCGRAFIHCSDLDKHYKASHLDTHLNSVT